MTLRSRSSCLRPVESASCDVTQVLLCAISNAVGRLLVKLNSKIVSKNQNNKEIVLLKSFDEPLRWLNALLARVNLHTRILFEANLSKCRPGYRPLFLQREGKKGFSSTLSPPI